MTCTGLSLSACLIAQEQEKLMPKFMTRPRTSSCLKVHALPIQTKVNALPKNNKKSSCLYLKFTHHPIPKCMLRLRTRKAHACMFKHCPVPKCMPRLRTRKAHACKFKHCPIPNSCLNLNKTCCQLICFLLFIFYFYQ